MVGLNADNLGIGGTWTLHLLSPEVDESWVNATYDEIANAPVLYTVAEELNPQDLAAGQANVFVFEPDQIAELEQRLDAGLISFRLVGPSQGADNLFTWDTGYGGGPGNRPALRLIYPPTPTPLVVAALPTATPTPANVLTTASSGCHSHV